MTDPHEANQIQAKIFSIITKLADKIETQLEQGGADPQEIYALTKLTEQYNKLLITKDKLTESKKKLEAENTPPTPPLFRGKTKQQHLEEEARWLKKISKKLKGNPKKIAKKQYIRFMQSIKDPEIRKMYTDYEIELVAFNAKKILGPDMIDIEAGKAYTKIIDEHFKASPLPAA